MRSGIRFGHVHGAPVVADASAFVLALLFGFAVLVDLETSELGSSDTNWIIASIAGIAVLGSVFVHELSHSVVAVREGLHVREIRLFMFGGYSVIDGRPSARTEAVVSVAGPVVSVLLGGVLWLVSMTLGDASPVGRAVYGVALANVAIGLFNLLPGFPLDGGRVLRGVLAARSGDRVAATRTVAIVGQWIGWASIGAGLVLLVRRSPIGLLILAAGWFLITTAASSGRREQLSATFDGLTVRDAMRETPDAIPGDWVIAKVIEMYAVGPRLRTLPVEMQGRVVGVLGQDEIDSISPSRWPSMRVRALMSEIGPADVVEAEEPLESLLLRPAGSTRRAVVTDHGVVVGVIEGSDLEKVLPERG